MINVLKHFDRVFRWQNQQRLSQGNSEIFWWYVCPWNSLSSDMKHYPRHSLVDHKNHWHLFVESCNRVFRVWFWSHISLADRGFRCQSVRQWKTLCVVYGRATVVRQREACSVMIDNVLCCHDNVWHCHRIFVLALTMSFIVSPWNEPL